MDPQYSKLGRIGLIGTIQDVYGTLVLDHECPALSHKLPQSNLMANQISQHH
jgi:hypothetical protein